MAAQLKLAFLQKHKQIAESPSRLQIDLCAKSAMMLYQSSEH